MKKNHLLKIVHNNRELIQRNVPNAWNDLQFLKENYTNFPDEEIQLNIELNAALSEIFFNSKYENAINISLNAIEKFADTTYYNILGRHYLIVGRCYALTGSYEVAEKYLSLALEKLTPEQNEFISLKTDILLALTMNEQVAGNGKEKSIEYLTEALDVLEGNEKHIVRKAGCYNGLGNVYINANEPHPALENFFKAVEIYEKLFDWGNIAVCYSNIGTCYIVTKEYDKAEEYLNKSLELRLKYGSPESICLSYHNLALVYKETDRLDLAEEILLKCCDVLATTSNVRSLQETEDVLAEVRKRKVAVAVCN